MYTLKNKSLKNTDLSFYEIRETYTELIWKNTHGKYTEYLEKQPYKVNISS